MKQKYNFIFAAMFLTLGLVLPFFTGQIPQIGKMLLPMHLPVLLCGLICGWKYGLCIGFILPWMRAFLFGTPVLYPTAIAMAFELSVYGAVSGYLFFRARWKCIRSLYACMVISMLAGRIVWGIVTALCLQFSGGVFTMKIFFAAAFYNALPGILLQFMFVPSVMLALQKTHLISFVKNFQVGEQIYGAKE